MMRARALILTFVLMFIIFSVSSIPLVVALPPGLSQGTDGTVWDGKVTGVDTPFGPADITFNADPTSFLSLSIAGDWTFDARGVRGDGIIERRLSGDTYLSDTSMTLNLAVLRLPRSLVGDLNLSIDHAGIDELGRCLEADGTVTTDILKRNQSILNWSGPDLSGPAQCDGDDLLVTLTGSDNTAEINFDYRMKPDGRYLSEARVTTNNTALKLALSYEGFEDRDGTLTKSFDGRWR